MMKDETYAHHDDPRGSTRWQDEQLCPHEAPPPWQQRGLQWQWGMGQLYGSEATRLWPKRRKPWRQPSLLQLQQPRPGANVGPDASSSSLELSGPRHRATLSQTRAILQ
ncbi:hypothetical protein ACFX1T_003878 [Malus domestica]